MELKLNKSGDKFLYRRGTTNSGDFNIWFVFPGTKSFALSSLGYLWLYKKIDQMDGVNIEMIYSETKETTIIRDKVDLLEYSSIKE